MAQATPEGGFVLRRIVVALDSSDDAAAAAEAAAGLAARFRAALEGLFVENEDLVNLAGLPVGRVVEFPSGTASEFDQAALERHLRRERDRARRALETAGRRLGVQPRFRVLRGRVHVQLVTAAAEADLLIVGVARRSLGRATRSVAVALVEGAPGAAAHAASVLGARPLVCYDGGPSAARALDAATVVAEADGRELRVALLARDAAEAAALRERASAALAARGVEGEFLECTPPTPERLCRIARERGADSLVVGIGGALFEGEGDGGRRLLEDAGCPVVLVR